LENKTRLQSYIDIFEKKFGKHANTEGTLVKVHPYHDNDDTSYVADFRASGNHLQRLYLPAIHFHAARWLIIARRNTWIDSTRGFATFIHNIPKSEIPLIKVAVIDNGVDAALEILDGKIASGMSFCPYPNSSYLMNPYYVTAESLGHGSVVAALICQMCPKARLYIGRLDERASSGSNREITAESAAEVSVSLHLFDSRF
jgi:hypothetical protein